MFLYTLLALGCSILYSVSGILCKFGLQHNIDVRALSIKELIIFLSKNKWWIIGVFLSGLANVSMIEIQARLDISIVYSLLNFSYIFVLILGHYFLHEHLEANQWFGITVVIIGTAMILGVRDPVTGVDTDFQNLVLITGAAILVVMSLIGVAYKNQLFNYEILYAICAGICFGCVEIFLKANTNLVADEIGKFTIFSMENIKHFLSVWPFFVMFAFGAFGWLFLQVAYTHGNVSVTIPVIAVMQRIVSLSSGYFVFGESFSILRSTGVITIVAGICILVYTTLVTTEEPETV